MCDTHVSVNTLLLCFSITSVKLVIINFKYKKIDEMSKLKIIHRQTSKFGSVQPKEKLPYLKSLNNISLMEQRLGNVVPLISEASYSLKNGKAFLKLRVSVVLTGCTSEFSMKSLKNMRSTFTIMVERYLEGKSFAVMLTTSCKHSIEVIHHLVRLRRLGWKHWKCMLTLDLSGNKFVVPGIDPERSPSFLQSLVKERVHLPNFSFYNKR